MTQLSPHKSKSIERKNSIKKGVRDSYLRKLVDDSLKLTDFGLYQEDLASHKELDDLEKFYADVEISKTVKKFSNSINFGDCKYGDIPLATDVGYNSETQFVFSGSNDKGIEFEKWVHHLNNDNSYYHVSESGEKISQIQIENRIWDIKNNDRLDKEQINFELEQKQIQRDLAKFHEDFRNIVGSTVELLGTEVKDILSETSKNIHDLNQFEDDDLPDTIDGISNSIERYFECYDEGRFASVYDSGYTLPSNSGHYASCMKLGLSGCIGDDVEIQDRDVSSAVYRERVHKKFNDYYNNGTLISHIKKIRLTCKRLSCDKCYKKSINHIAKSGSLRMLSFIGYMVSNFGFNKKRVFNHSVVSIPKERYDEMRDPVKRKKIEKTMLSNLKEIGVDGGLMIYHPFRFTKKLKSAFFSPHYHFVLSGFTTPDDVKRFYEKTGLTYIGFKNKDSDGKAFVGEDRLYHTIRYIVCHCGVMDDKHSIRYFGYANNRFFKTDEILSHAVDSLDDLKSTLHKVITPKLNPKSLDYTVSHLYKIPKLLSIKTQQVTFKDGDIETMLVQPVKYPKIQDDVYDNISDPIFDFLLDKSVNEYGSNGIDNAPYFAK